MTGLIERAGVSDDPEEMKALASLITASAAWVKANKSEEQQVGELASSAWAVDGEPPVVEGRPVVQRSTVRGG